MEGVKSPPVFWLPGHTIPVFNHSQVIIQGNYIISGIYFTTYIRKLEKNKALKKIIKIIITPGA